MTNGVKKVFARGAVSQVDRPAIRVIPIEMADHLAWWARPQEGGSYQPVHPVGSPRAINLQAHGWVSLWADVLP
jgi:hypothetical protein